MANYSIYFSPTGGTKKVADIITDSLNGEYSEIDLCRNIEALSLNPTDICLISIPSYGGRVPGIAIQRLKRITANGAKAVLNCVYGNRDWDDTLTELQDTLCSIGFKCTCAIAAVAEHSVFRQFATGRPDEQDKVQLHEFAIQIQRVLDNDTAKDLVLPGNHGIYKEFGGSPLKPIANNDCTRCGLCAKECPVNAIDPTSPQTTDSSLCISCMRCVSLCPKHARDFNPELLAEIGNKMADKLGGRKNNFLFI